MFLLFFSFFFILNISAERVTLDVSRALDPKKFIVTNYGTQELPQIMYSTVGDISITRVVNGNQMIWKQEKRNEICVYFVLFKTHEQPKLGFALIKYGKKTYGIHYECIKDIWKEISLARYDHILEKMIILREIDVSRVENRLVVAHKFHPFGIMANIYFPNEYCEIHKVMDQKVILWEAENFEEKCEYLVIHGNIGNPKLVELFIRDESNYDRFYYSKNDEEGWIQVGKDDFYDKLDEMDGVFGTKL